jgi:tetratricopeptide (TPR) repeat protein
VNRFRRVHARLKALARTARPREAGDYLSRGLDRQDQGDLAGAIADYDRAIARHPSYAAAYLSRGLAHRQAGDLERARADFRLVPELTSDPRWREQAEEQLRAVTGE